MDPNDRSLTQASSEAEQQLRVFSDTVIQQLDDETSLVIEVNGEAVANITCVDSALAELATGWAFMYRYFESPLEFDRVSVDIDRASVMIHGGLDIAHHRAFLNGEAEGRIPVPEPWPRDDEWSIPDDVLLDILREAWALFRNDRLAEGSVHAALASSPGIEVVAFDITSNNAVAKVLGWSLRNEHYPGHEILIVNGAITRLMVDAAVRLGVLIIATPYAPTADAWRAARLAGISMVGYMRNRTAGLYLDTGLVSFDEPVNNDT